MKNPLSRKRVSSKRKNLLKRTLKKNYRKRVRSSSKRVRKSSKRVRKSFKRIKMSRTLKKKNYRYSRKKLRKQRGGAKTLFSEIKAKLREENLFNYDNTTLRNGGNINELEGVFHMFDKGVVTELSHMGEEERGEKKTVFYKIGVTWTMDSGEVCEYIIYRRFSDLRLFNTVFKQKALLSMSSWGTGKNVWTDSAFARLYDKFPAKNAFATDKWRTGYLGAYFTMFNKIMRQMEGSEELLKENPEIAVFRPGYITAGNKVGLDSRRTDGAVDSVLVTKLLDGVIEELKLAQDGVRQTGETRPSVSQASNSPTQRRRTPTAGQGSGVEFIHGTRAWARNLLEMDYDTGWNALIQEAMANHRDAYNEWDTDEDSDIETSAEGLINIFPQRLSPRGVDNMRALAKSHLIILTIPQLFKHQLLVAKTYENLDGEVMDMATKKQELHQIQNKKEKKAELIDFILYLNGYEYPTKPPSAPEPTQTVPELTFESDILDQDFIRKSLGFTPGQKYINDAEGGIGKNIEILHEAKIQLSHPALLGDFYSPRSDTLNDFERLNYYSARSEFKLPDYSTLCCDFHHFEDLILFLLQESANSKIGKESQFFYYLDLYPGEMCVAHLAHPGQLVEICMRMFKVILEKFCEKFDAKLDGPWPIHQKNFNGLSRPLIIMPENFRGPRKFRPTLIYRFGKHKDSIFPIESQALISQYFEKYFTGDLNKSFIEHAHKMVDKCHYEACNSVRRTDMPVRANPQSIVGASPLVSTPYQAPGRVRQTDELFEGFTKDNFVVDGKHSLPVGHVIGRGDGDKRMVGFLAKTQGRPVPEPHNFYYRIDVRDRHIENYCIYIFAKIMQIFYTHDEDEASLSDINFRSDKMAVEKLDPNRHKECFLTFLSLGEVDDREKSSRDDFSPDQGPSEQRPPAALLLPPFFYELFKDFLDGCKFFSLRYLRQNVDLTRSVIEGGGHIVEKSDWKGLQGKALTSRAWGKKNTEYSKKLGIMSNPNLHVSFGDWGDYHAAIQEGTEPYFDDLNRVWMKHIRPETEYESLKTVYKLISHETLVWGGTEKDCPYDNNRKLAVTVMARANDLFYFQFHKYQGETWTTKADRLNVSARRIPFESKIINQQREEYEQSERLRESERRRKSKAEEAAYAEKSRLAAAGQVRTNQQWLGREMDVKAREMKMKSYLDSPQSVIDEILNATMRDPNEGVEWSETVLEENKKWIEEGNFIWHKILFENEDRSKVPLWINPHTGAYEFVPPEHATARYKKGPERWDNLYEWSEDRKEAATRGDLVWKEYTNTETGETMYRNCAMNEEKTATDLTDEEYNQVWAFKTDVHSETHEINDPSSVKKKRTPWMNCDDMRYEAILSSLGWGWNAKWEKWINRSSGREVTCSSSSALTRCPSIELIKKLADGEVDLIVTEGPRIIQEAANAADNPTALREVSHPPAAHAATMATVARGFSRPPAAKTASSSSESLPRGWTKVTNQGTPFYYNSRTRTSVWDKPRA